MPYYIYILASRKNGTMYIGVTSNLVKRIYEHKEGLLEGFTKKFKVKDLIYYNRQVMLTKLLFVKSS